MMLAGHRLGGATRSLTVGAVLVLSACSGGATRSFFPSRLGTTVHRVEEEGIDYSSVGMMRFELTLRADGTGSALRSTRAADVLGSDTHETDATVRYTAVARQDGDGFVVSLTPEAGSPPMVEAVELVCERWSADARAESSEVETPSLPGVEWICALPEGRIFALDRAAVQHVPREGTFLLLGTTRDAVVRERIDGGGRGISTRPAE